MSPPWPTGRCTGAELESLALARPSLEDVYLDLIGAERLAEELTEGLTAGPAERLPEVEVAP